MSQREDYPGKRHFVPEKGESVAQVYTRAREFLIEACLAIVEEENQQKQQQQPQLLISTHGGVAIELFAFLVRELGCPPPDGKTAAQMIAIPGNTALASFELTLDAAGNAGKKIDQVVSRPADLITGCRCITIHDRTHCES